MRAAGPRGTALAAATLALGLGTGAAATAGIATAERDATTAALTLRSAGVHAALDTAFQRYADTVHDIAAAAATQPAATLSPTVARIAGARLAGAHQVVVTDAAGGILAQHTVDGSTPPPRTALDPEPRLAETMRLAGRTAASSPGRCTSCPPTAACRRPDGPPRSIWSRPCTAPGSAAGSWSPSAHPSCSGSRCARRTSPA
ncbi:hypothetical protein BG844_13900 [Couchioplanes caeruleus subsp. caeruleus]|uniref:Uncharacterized protein n=2 Tax=Couchioplanes caeruleus TaxID=56438 RepID=A0A1K0FLK6_9ACTN|nr:hypothetical protein BG844_13900 [Couchioplanes caeruleus subsp. caeruleus]